MCVSVFPREHRARCFVLYKFNSCSSRNVRTNDLMISGILRPGHAMHTRALCALGISSACSSGARQRPSLAATSHILADPMGKMGALGRH
jgi:hypothetical protein